MLHGLADGFEARLITGRVVKKALRRLEVMVDRKNIDEAHAPEFDESFSKILLVALGVRALFQDVGG